MRMADGIRNESHWRTKHGLKSDNYVLRCEEQFLWHHEKGIEKPYEKNSH